MLSPLFAMSGDGKDLARHLEARLCAAKMAIDDSPGDAKDAVAAIQARAVLSLVRDIGEQGGLEDEVAADITTMASSVPWGGTHLQDILDALVKPARGPPEPKPGRGKVRRDNQLMMPTLLGYFTNAEWNVLLATSVPAEVRMEQVYQRMLQLNLRNPSEECLHKLGAWAILMEFGPEMAWSTPIAQRVEAVEKIKRRFRALRKSTTEPKDAAYPPALEGLPDHFKLEYPSLYDATFRTEAPVPSRVRITDVQCLAATWDVRGGLVKAALAQVPWSRSRSASLALMPPGPWTAAARPPQVLMLPAPPPAPPTVPPTQPSARVALRDTYPMTALQALSAATQASAPQCPGTVTPTTPRTPNPITPRERQHADPTDDAALAIVPMPCPPPLQAVGPPEPAQASPKPVQAVGPPEPAQAGALDALPRPKPTQAPGLPPHGAPPRPRPTQAPGLPPFGSQPALGPPEPATASAADEDSPTEDRGVGALAAGILADFIAMERGSRVAKRNAKATPSATPTAPTSSTNRRRILRKTSSLAEPPREPIPSTGPPALADAEPPCVPIPSTGPPALGPPEPPCEPTPSTGPAALADAAPAKRRRILGKQTSVVEPPRAPLPPPPSAETWERATLAVARADQATQEEQRHGFPASMRAAEVASAAAGQQEVGQQEECAAPKASVAHESTRSTFRVRSRSMPSRGFRYKAGDAADRKRAEREACEFAASL